MWILGVAGSHNGAVALVHDGKVVAALQAERMTRVKRHLIRIDQMGADVRQLARACLDQAGVGPEVIDVIATCSPWASGTAPRLLNPSAWFDASDRQVPSCITVPHHLAHAEYALHYSPLERSLVLVLDGSGTAEDQRAALDLKERERDPIKHIEAPDAKESISAYTFDGRDLELVYRFAGGDSDHLIAGVGRPYLHSLGHLWRWAASYCCGDIHEAGKVMGLAPYGDPGRIEPLRYLDFDERTGALRISFDALARLPRPNKERRDITGDTHYEDIAAHLQAATGDLLVRLVRFLEERWPAPDLCYAGGVALNGIANERLIREGNLRVHMNGSCEDNGTAIGAALAVFHHLTGQRVAEDVTEHYGPSYGDHPIEQALAARGIVAPRRPLPEVLRSAAEALAAGRVVAWFQGRGEFGPRALGNRSILADPRDPGTRETLNVKIKRRERYRPYAPAVLEERAAELFDMEGASPSMLRVVPCKVDFLPAVTHVDGSARVQTVSRRDNPIFYDLIRIFGEITGVPAVLNTSFNRAGQPIVETPADALDAFLTMKMDLLVLHDRMVDRNDLKPIEEQAPSSESGPVAVRADEWLVVPHAPRYLVWNTPHGDGDEIVRIHALTRVIELEAAALPLVEALCRTPRFLAGEAMTWAPYTWEGIRDVLEVFLENGLLRRDGPG